MNNIKKYVIIRKDDIKNLEETINNMLDTGWYPMGGITFANNKFYQAMVNVNEIKKGM